ncbi:MAG: hypothetical protein LBQ42_07230 [Synergistaceae bacterium]|jgi:hypothetical protein|nr:hypothetical protein [Synergistaceae bacterium]
MRNHGKKRFWARTGFTATLVLTAAIFASAPVFAAQGLLVKRHEMLDPQMNDAVAATVAVPDGWEIGKGSQVVWNLNIYANPAYLMFEVNGPDEAKFVYSTPFKFHFNQKWPMFTPPASFSQLQIDPDFGVLALQLMTASDFLNWLLKQNSEISGVRIKEITRPQGLDSVINKAVEEENARDIPRLNAMASCNIYQGRTYDLAVAEYSYVKEGKRHEEVGFIVANYRTWMSTSPLSYGKYSILWDVQIMAMSALEGKLKAHENDFALILSNSGPDPVWAETVETITTQGMLREIKRQEDAIRTIRAAQVRASNNQSAIENRRQAQSNVTRGWTNAITGVDTWSGGGEKYDAPTGYGYAWRNGDGNTYYTNDSTFNPNHSSNFSGDWSQMEKVPW